MPVGWNALTSSIRAMGPVGWWNFAELLAGQAVSAGGQDPQNFAFDGSASGNLNPGSIPNPNGNYLIYGSAVTANGPSGAATLGLNDDTAAVFPNTATLSLTNIITGGNNISPTLQPTAAISVGAQITPSVIVGGAKQVMTCYGSDASSLAAYNLYHTGSSAVNHQFAFSVNIAGTLRTATATLPLLVAGTSYFALGTYDGANVRIYVNGVLQGTTAITGAISYASIAGSGLSFGNDQALSDGNIQGSMGLSAIYNRALTQAQITYLARQGSAYLPFPWSH